LIVAIRQSPLVAACLSFLVPGLGQAWAGARRRAALFLLPLVLLVAVALALLSRGLAFSVGVLLQPETLVALLVIDVGLLALRLAAIVDAFRMARRRWPARAPGRITSIIVALSLLGGLGVMHGAAAYFGYEALDTVTTVFEGGGEDAAAVDPYGTPGPDTAILGPGSGAAEPAGSSEPGLEGDNAAGNDAAGSPAPDATRPAGDVGTATAMPSPSATAMPSPSATVVSSPSATVVSSPSATGPGAPLSTASTASPISTVLPTPIASPTPAPKPGWADDGRLNVLVIGGDAGPDRWSLRTDTLILVSVDIASGRAALFGIPRNLYNVPLPDRLAGLFTCRCFPKMLNELYSYADLRPGQFPGGKSRGYLAVGATIEALTGVDLDGMVVADLRGFVELVDAIGGLSITIKKPLYDSHYPLEDGSGWMEVYFAPGRYHLTGRMALAYARSRHQDSDYGRMARQQEVLLALRRQAKPACLIPKVGQLAKIVRSSLWTNISVRNLGGLLELASRVDPRTVERFAFNPPGYREYLQADDVARIRAVVNGVFEGPVPAPAPGSEPALDDSSC
jgi:LCP family protein required for cell wall assembly